MIADRITEDADWRDGINLFRLRILESIKTLEEEIEELKQQIKGETP